MVKIMDISEQCTGCTACASVCQTHALLMVTTPDGFLYPQLSENQCVKCGQCERVCTILNPSTAKDITNKSYAVKANDDELRRKSASGAFFQIAAEFYVSNGGYVCGCILDEGLYVKHIVTNRLEDVRNMADSKYVQSDLGRCFNDIKVLLYAGKKVLFSGTSCQVQGLNQYLLSEKCDTENLITIDFFCHGVPSPGVWKDFIEYYERKRKVKVTDFRFRCKDYGWGEAARGTNYLHTLYYRTDEKGDIYKDRSLLVRKWRQIFFSDYALRKGCASCKYCTVDKPADITMGDFWKLNKVLPEFNDDKGTSIVITHNEHADMFLKSLEGMSVEETDVVASLQGQKNAYEGSKLPAKYEKFWKDYHGKGFGYVLRKYYYSPFCLFKDVVKIIRYKLHLGDL